MIISRGHPYKVNVSCVLLIRLIEELLLGFLIICLGLGSENVRGDLDVTNFGGLGDGKNDDTQALLKAWEAACGASGSQTLQIPSGKTFLLQPLSLKGPCKSTSVHLQLQGNIVAPSNPGDWAPCEKGRWISFEDVEGLIVDGSGRIDGQGAPWWKGASGGKCPQKPTSLAFHNCKNLQLKGITLINSPRNHITINQCTRPSLSGLHIIVPEDSPNTDGIDISRSTQVNIQNSFIGTGDDCVAINDGCVDINITSVTCSPGHGISIGSLGANGAKETVEQVRVQNCVFNRTQNGARIKTWPGGSGYAKSISFEQITLVDAKNPIIIDQHYCNGDHNCPEKTSAVAISDVKFIGFHGTSSGETAIKLDCSKVTGCNNIVLNQVNITSAVPRQQLGVVCNNVKGTSENTVPPVHCLSR